MPFLSIVSMIAINDTNMMKVIVPIIKRDLYLLSKYSLFYFELQMYKLNEGLSVITIFLSFITEYYLLFIQYP
jgi:hypothetical protein